MLKFGSYLRIPRIQSRVVQMTSCQMTIVIWMSSEVISGEWVCHTVRLSSGTIWRYRLIRLIYHLYGDLYGPDLPVNSPMASKRSAKGIKYPLFERTHHRFFPMEVPRVPSGKIRLQQYAHARGQTGGDRAKGPQR